MAYRSILSAQVFDLVIDFGSDIGSDMARLTVTDARMTTSTQILLTEALPSADHDAEDSLIEGVRFVAIAGTGNYEIIAHAPFGTWGRYNVQAYCIYG